VAGRAWRLTLLIAGQHAHSLVKRMAPGQSQQSTASPDAVRLIQAAASGLVAF